MSEEDPPPGGAWKDTPHLMKKYTECSTLSELRESVIDDIKHYESQRIPENGDYISHVLGLLIDAKTDYMMEKFGIDENDLL